MSWYIYILLCDKKTYYVGLTSNLNNRINPHKNKYNLATKRFLALELVYKEVYVSRKEAENREKQLKGWSVAKKKALIEGKFELLRQLSKTQSLVEE